jgi:hypothetical protein
MKLLPTPLKSGERSVLFDPTFDTIYSLVQRVSHTYMYYPRGIPKVAYIHVVLSVDPCTICKCTSSDPFTYIRTTNRGVCPLILVYVHSRGLGLGFRLQRNLGLVRLQLWAWILVKTKFC